MTALRALRESRTDVEALDLTVDRLRRFQEVATTMADDARARADRVLVDRTAAQADADAGRPDAQQAHRPQQHRPHCGREAGH